MRPHLLGSAPVPGAATPDQPAAPGLAGRAGAVGAAAPRDGAPRQGESASDYEPLRNEFPGSPSVTRPPSIFAGLLQLGTSLKLINVIKEAEFVKNFTKSLAPTLELA